MWEEVGKKIKKATGNIRIALFGKISSVIKSDSTVYIESSDEEEIRDIRIITPYGIYSLPTPDVFGQVIFNNSTKKATLVGVEDDKAKPVTLNIGEVLIYKPGGTSYIHLKNDNSIYIKGDIIFNNGSKNIARVDDTVEVNVGGTVYTGKITSGANNLKA